MAYFDADALRTRIRALLEDGEGSLRKVPDGRFDGGYWDGSDTSQGRARSLVANRYDIPYIRTERRRDFSIIGNRQNLQVFPVIVCEYTLEHPNDSDENRDDAIALAEQDADVLQQSIEFNLGADDGTGIIQGSCMYEGSEVVDYDPESRRLVVRHNFTAIAHVTVAAS